MAKSPSFTPTELHTQAITLREQGKTADALSSYEAVLVEYIATDNTEGIIRTLLEKDVSYRHLWFFTESPTYLELAASTLQLAEHIFHQNEDHLPDELHVLILLHIGQISASIGEHLEAVEVYQEALQALDSDTAQYGNILSQLAVSEWHSGQQEAAQTHFDEAETILETAPPADEFTAVIWKTGSWLRRAECLLATDRDQAQHLLIKAEEFLTEEKHPIRWRQLQKVRHSLES